MPMCSMLTVTETEYWISEVQPLMDVTLGQLNFLESHDGQCLTTMRGKLEI